MCVQSPHEDPHGRRYSAHLQRLRAGIYLHRCRSGVFSRTRLFEPEALQAVSSGQKERSGKYRLPFRSSAGNTSDLFRLRPAHHSALRAAWRPPGLLPGLLHGAQGERRRRGTCPRTLLARKQRGFHPRQSSRNSRQDLGRSGAQYKCALTSLRWRPLFAPEAPMRSAGIRICRKPIPPGRFATPNPFLLRPISTFQLSDWSGSLDLPAAR
jgi:hypothetical protein